MNSEMALLNLLIDTPDLLLQCEHLRAEDFGDDTGRHIFAALRRLHSDGKEPDLALLVQEVGKAVPLADIMAIADDFVPRSNFPHHLAAVVQASTRRKVTRLGNELLSIAGDAKPDEVITKAEEAVLALRRNTPASFEPIDAGLDEVWADISQRIVHGGHLKGIPSGWPDLDLYTFGWQPGKLYYIAARPAMGKTAWLIQAASHVARQGKPVLFISLEMSRSELLQRVICQEARIPSHKLQIGDITEKEQDAVSKTLRGWYGKPFTVVDTPGLSIEQIRDIARKAKLRHGGLAAVFVDYLSYIGGKAESHRLLVEKNSAGLKQLARELNCAVICAAQLSRSVEARADRRPLLSDLRETGGIEQDADLAAFIYRPSYYAEFDREADEIQSAELLIRKNREGQTGTVYLAWRGPLLRFESLPSK